MQPTRLKSLQYAAEYLLVRFFDGLFCLLGYRLGLPLARALGSLIYYVRGRYRKVALENLRHALGAEHTEKELRRIARRAFQNLAMNMVEFCLFPRIVNLQNFDRFVRFRNEQMVKDWLAQGHSAILVSAHLGNWELGACAVSMKAVPCYSIARPLKNPILDRWLNEMRQRTGARVFPKTGALRSMVRYLHEGKLLVFLLDQHAGDKGIPVEFFGRKAYTFDSVATISKRFHVPVFLAFDRRIDDRFFHEMRCVARVDPDAGSVEELTAQYTRLIEQAVRETPDQWLWMHRRWKESKPRASADKVPPADPVHGLASESQASGAPPMAT